MECYVSEKDSQNSPRNIIQPEDDDDFVAYSVSSREIWGRKESLSFGRTCSGRVSINTFICGLKPILPPASTPSECAYHHRNCFRKYLILSFYDDWVQQNFRWPAAVSCGWMANEPAFREPPCLFSSSCLMTRTDLVLKTLVRSPSSHLTRLLAT